MTYTLVDFISMAVFLVVFILTCAVGAVLLYRSYGFDRQMRTRLRELAPESDAANSAATDPAKPALAALGEIMLPSGEDKIRPFVKQMRRAGFDQPRALQKFYGVKFVLILSFPLVCAVVPFLAGYLSLRWAFFASSAASAAGIVLPNLWLEARVNKRLRELRAGLPDMLDMLVMCIEGGLSFQAGLQRVLVELQEVHGTLGRELQLVMQSIELGASVGEAFKQFGERCDMAEVRDLAAVVEQSEKYGASLIKALRTYADQFREERQMRAEEAAQKASVKILFPMLICIFPAIFVVLLGPASFQMAKLFKH